ncbi:hypothetical protein A4G20_02285 [Pasteurellaceae bacterium RH1A]|nr:hypothetical protein A4G20_02285 [Pasteurellaceae bacterium RH1A]
MKKTTLSLVIAALMAQAARASEQLAPVIVYANLPQNASLISAKQLQNAGIGNKNINELLTTLPSVRTSSSSGSGQTLGEIAPQNLSFYGERYYNNNFMVNGISTNDNINPIGLGENGVLSRDRTLTIDPEWLPSGHPQAFWLNPDLLKQVKVFDSNVPSRYGYFTGGVVDAELDDPDFSRPSGFISYRTTRSAWVKFHLDGQYRDAFHQAHSPLMQPKFVKHQYSLKLNQPLSNHSALLFAYERQTAEIPQHHQYLKYWVDQKRRNETFLVRYKNDWNDNNTLLATLMYSPHIGDYHMDNVKNGGFRESGGGFLGSLNWKNYNSLGLLSTELAYRQTKNQTKYAANLLENYALTPSIDWVSDPDPDYGFARRGGIGKRYTTQENVLLKQELAFNALQLGNHRHKFTLGWEYHHNRSALKQPEMAIQYSGARQYYGQDEHYRPFDLADCTDCIPKEQYATGKTIYHPLTGKVKHNKFALYLEDEWKWKDLTLTPGLRLDYGQFLNQFNLAPRFHLDYDLKGQDKTHFIAGLNRYYADDLLDYQLRSSFNFYDEYNRYDYEDGWSHSESKLNIKYKGAKLKTPYSDEVNLGLSHKIANSLWKLKWVQRQSKQQFMTRIDYEASPQQRWLSNGGRTTTNNVSLSAQSLTPWKTRWAELGWEFAISYQKSKSNQTVDYTQRDWQDYDIEKMLYKGKLQPISQMPAQRFNQPWTAALKINTYFPGLNLAWLHVVNYQSGSRHFSRTGTRCSADIAACGDYRGLVARVTEVKYPREITLDWNFIWKKRLTDTQALSLNLSVLNVLNHVAKAERVTEDAGDSYYQTYKPGRQFWLGAKYEW